MMTKERQVKKRGSDRSRIFDADGAEYVHGGDAEKTAEKHISISPCGNF